MVGCVDGWSTSVSSAHGLLWGCANCQNFTSSGSLLACEKFCDPLQRSWSLLVVWSDARISTSSPLLKHAEPSQVQICARSFASAAPCMSRRCIVAIYHELCFPMVLNRHLWLKEIQVMVYKARQLPPGAS